MANIKVSEMNEATSFDDGDYTMIVQANQNKKISKENMMSEVGELANLETTNKSNIVNSINEVNSIATNNAKDNIYSLNEIDTGKIWIDGKPIFRKVIETNVSANSTETEDLTNIDYDKIWINDNSFNNYNVTGSAKVNWYNGSNDYGLVYINTSKILNIKNMSSVPRTYYIIIEYTKAS